MRCNMKNNRSQIIKKIVFISIFTALSTVLYHLRFPLPMFFPSFLDVQFSNLPALIGALLLGPWSGVLIVVLRGLLKLPFTSSAGVGELADVLIGVAAVLSAGLYYKYHRTKKGGVIALLLSTVFWIVAAVLANYFILMPFFIKVIGFDAVFGALGVIKGITRKNFMEYYILFAVIPFNLMLSVLVNTVTYFVYKRISKIWKDFMEGKD